MLNPMYLVYHSAKFLPSILGFGGRRLMTLQVPMSRAAMVPPAALTAVQFHTLAAIPPKLEWFGNLPESNMRKI